MIIVVIKQKNKTDSIHMERRVVHTHNEPPLLYCMPGLPASKTEEKEQVAELRDSAACLFSHCFAFFFLTPRRIR